MSSVQQARGAHRRLPLRGLQATATHRQASGLRMGSPRAECVLWHNLTPHPASSALSQASDQALLFMCTAYLQTTECMHDLGGKAAA